MSPFLRCIAASLTIFAVLGSTAKAEDNPAPRPAPAAYDGVLWGVGEKGRIKISFSRWLVDGRYAPLNRVYRASSLMKITGGVFSRVTGDDYAIQGSLFLDVKTGELLNLAGEVVGRSLAQIPVVFPPIEIHDGFMLEPSHLSMDEGDRTFRIR